MGEKLILGCAWCERVDDVELSICCRRHGRLVCGECREKAPYQGEHQPASVAS